MKRILAAFVLLTAGAWASAQVNGQGGVYINGVLQAAASWDYLHAGGITMTAPTSDVAPNPLLLKSANAWPGASSNTAGADTIIAGGIGKRIFTVVDYSNGTMAGSTATITVNGSATVLTEGAAADWLAATSNNATATSLAAAIDAVSGVSAAASTANVRITPDVGTYSLTIAKSAADAGMTATSGSDGTVIGGGAGAANTALSNLADVAINLPLTTGAGIAAALTATAPAATASTQAGIAAGLTASAAVAGTENVGAAAGGSVTIAAGDAARLTSGNANGGDIVLTPGAGIGTGTSGVVRVPDGASGAPGIQIGTGALGFYKVDAETIRMAAPSAPVLQSFFFQCTVYNRLSYNLGLQFPYNSQVSWGPNALYGSDDAGIGRASASVVKVTDASTGYGAISLDTNSKTLADTVTLTDAVKTAVVDIAIADAEFAGGTLTYTITSTDATDHQALTGIVGFSGVRKAGSPSTYHVTIAESATPVLAESSGGSTLTDTWTIDEETDKVTISVTADSSLTTPTMTVRYQLTLNSANAVSKK